MKTLTSLLLILLTFSSFGQEKEVSSTIESVIVYRKKAKITRKTSTQLTAGKHTLIMSDVSSSLDPNSLNISLGSKVVLLSARYEPNYLKENTERKIIFVLKDSIEMIDYEIKKLNNKKETSTGEIKLIEGNSKLGTDEKAPNVEDIQNMARFYQSRILILKNEILDLERSIKKKQEHKENRVKLNGSQLCRRTYLAYFSFHAGAHISQV